MDSLGEEDAGERGHARVLEPRDFLHLHINVLWYRGGLVFEAHRLLYYSDRLLYYPASQKDSGERGHARVLLSPAWRWSSNPSGKCSYERPTRGTVCGTLRSMCGSDAGCLAMNYRSLFHLLGGAGVGLPLSSECGTNKTVIWYQQDRHVSGTNNMVHIRQASFWPWLSGKSPFFFFQVVPPSLRSGTLMHSTHTNYSACGAMR